MNKPSFETVVTDHGPTVLHARLAAAAAAEGVLDIAYRTLDTPVGTLLLAATADEAWFAERQITAHNISGPAGSWSTPQVLNDGNHGRRPYKPATSTFSSALAPMQPRRRIHAHGHESRENQESSATRRIPPVAGASQSI
jgi:hypothetical protein